MRRTKCLINSQAIYFLDKRLCEVLFGDSSDHLALLKNGPPAFPTGYAYICVSCFPGAINNATHHSDLNWPAEFLQIITYIFSKAYNIGF